MSSDKLSKEKLYFERLTEIHIKSLPEFRCTEKELEKFLVEDAWINQQQGISVTYLWFLKDAKQLVGYVTLLTDSINLNADLKNFFREKDIHYKSLPALKIGRMAVSESMMRKGIGSMLIRFSIAIALKVYSEFAGCRFVILEAKRGNNLNDPIHFYKAMGFNILTEREKGTIPMYLDVWIKGTGGSI
ncbi:MAG: GNAT family N-acetyltransferase [Candidatus Micrarchaeota archaeon]|nr:GNAT family N-acetyltransferase [Candidatus Micrarchaeota archaeon]